MTDKTIKYYYQFKNRKYLIKMSLIGNKSFKFYRFKKKLCKAKYPYF